MRPLSRTERQVADFIRDTTWPSLPADVREASLLCLMDNVASTIVGAGTIVAGIAAGFARDALPGDEARVVCGGSRASTLGAAFANGVAANGTDIDDGGLYTGGYPGAQVLPAALALAESRHTTGDAFLAATVVGYEIMFRTGRCWYDNDPILRGCGSLGVSWLCCHRIKSPAANTHPDRQRIGHCRIPLSLVALDA